MSELKRTISHRRKSYFSLFLPGCDGAHEWLVQYLYRVNVNHVPPFFKLSITQFLWQTVAITHRRACIPSIPLWHLARTSGKSDGRSLGARSWAEAKRVRHTTAVALSW